MSNPPKTPFGLSLSKPVSERRASAMPPGETRGAQPLAAAAPREPTRDPRALSRRPVVRRLGSEGQPVASLIFDTDSADRSAARPAIDGRRHWPYATALTGAAIVLAFYLLVGGRVFCSWVCPVNVVTDAAAWSRRKLGIKTGRAPTPTTRFWLLGGGTARHGDFRRAGLGMGESGVALHRALIFGLWGSLLGDRRHLRLRPVDRQRGWCGHLCPVGAFYGLLGRIAALVRVSAAQRSACDDCMDCFVVCPEPQVIRPALKQAGQTHPLILSGDCTNCGRCIDVCDRQVFKMTHRFDQRSA